ncbi:hypothetical protein SBRCBS47491_009076 [Sporothrix bragantina]|uniref:Cupin type-2 domain-containing protein n=1 Tax=Sporothrix bragantina TaxID=671064 RepID=A0ABP0CSP1_9PEZI
MSTSTTEANGSADTSPLPVIRQYVTTNDQATGKAVLASGRDAVWRNHRNGEAYMTEPFSTSKFPEDLNDSADIRSHEAFVSGGEMSLVREGGTVCRVVDFCPANVPAMHRTRSLDYGVVLEGEVELILDSGEVYTMRRGDVAVQRATMHAWRNASNTEWARMLFMLQDCAPVQISGAELVDDINSVAMPGR